MVSDESCRLPRQGVARGQCRLQVRLYPQYSGLEKLYQDKRARGREVLGFPANNFEKFLLGRNGEVVGRFSPDVTAEDSHLLAAVDAELTKTV
jgi:glutathione peroxidase-family protein